MIIPLLTQSDSPSLSKKNTGLGNALFQIFTAYGLSKKYNHTFNNSCLPELLVKLKNFSLNHSETIYRNLKIFKNIPPRRLYLNEKPNYYSLYDTDLIKNINKINDDICILLRGYVQSHMYFDDYYGEIVNLIKPDEKSIEYIKQKYPHLFDRNNINISIHVRFNWGFNISYNVEYFYEAIYYLKNKLDNKKNLIINIFSDNIEKVEKFFNFEETVHIFKNNEDYIDMWCMSLCNHNILSHSTISWWGAYINLNKDKIIVYPEDILRLENATIYKDLQLTDRKTQHYKKDWVGLKTKNVIYQ
tara:strand:+ start:95 stop:1000 length:906 start_codon:yes stop_codon:yes gene_type:complete